MSISELELPKSRNYRVMHRFQLQYVIWDFPLYFINIHQVRQLEAITRIAESLARIELAPIANTGHIAEAIRLFKVSTVQAGNTGHIAQGAGCLYIPSIEIPIENLLRFC
jgi:hypothetical protein